MDSKFSPIDSLPQPPGESTLRNISATVSGNSIEQSQSSDNAEQDDGSFARAATLIMPLSGESSEAEEVESQAETLRYVQGVIQGQKAYIITNLLGESQALFQPQMVWTIGRNRDAALPLKDRAMSRRHAVLLYVKDTGFQLVDLNSMNGSFINGTRLYQRQDLKDGDRIRIGSINFMFFVSQNFRSLDTIHPEVLARFTATESEAAAFIDYSDLEAPEVLSKGFY